MKEETDAHLAMHFKRHPSRYYQGGNRKSGGCEWHGRTRKLRRLQKAIMQSTGVVGGDLARRIAAVLDEEE